MATTPSRSRKQASKPPTDAFTCPECGKTFTRAAALGAHRKLKHGVAGRSANASSNRANVKRRSRSRATPASRPAATTAATDGARQSVDRDALLRTLFPDGIPPRQAVIAQV